jgi:predicted GNAT family N-acyltransferase
LGETLSKTTIKNIDGFSNTVQAAEAILIGQLGKNANYRSDIAGQTILARALDTVYEIHELVGGRIVYLECEDHPKLIDFYTRNGFRYLQKSGKYIQMIRYL